MEIFKLFGSILVDTDKADESISKTDNKAKGFISRLGNGIATAAKWGAGIVAAAGSAAIAVGTVAVNAADDYQKALNKLQVQTGATNENMTELGDVIRNVYGNNFGEDMNEVAESVALVKKNLNLTGDELQNVTEYALGFRDAFGYETEESTRAAKAMMDQFGISAEEAFNLMVQGEQQGLDYSGELIDNINEYSVHFAQLGLSAEDMFNVFLDGSAEGAFNLDKIGDAVKELGIRIKEGSANDALKELGFDADEVVKKFNDGGDSAKEAFYGIFEALGKVDDQTKLNTLGTSLMGTMYEDLGKEAIIALGEMSDGFNKTIDSANQMNSIQYNSFSEAIAGIKRQVESNILIPLGELVLPTLNKFANWFAGEGQEYIKKFSNTIMSIMPYVASIFLNVFNAITGAISFLENIFNQVTGNISFSWSDLLSKIKLFWESIGKPIFDAFCTIFNTIYENVGPIISGLQDLWLTLMSFVSTCWDSIGKPVFDFFINIVNKLVEVFNYVFPILANIFSGLCDTLKLFWENIGKPVFEAVGAFISNVLLPLWEEKFSKMADKVMNIFNNIGELWNNVLKPILDGIILFIGGIFQGNWSKAWDGIKSILKGLWEGLKSILFSPIEWFLGKIDGSVDTIASPFRKAADAISNIWSSIKSVFKLPHFTLEGSLNPLKWIDEGMPSIGVDWYAKGGIFTKPTVLPGGIGVGDADNGKGSNPEAVIPLDILWSKLDKIANRPIIVQASNGKELMKFLAPYKDELEKYELGR